MKTLIEHIGVFANNQVLNNFYLRKSLFVFFITLIFSFFGFSQSANMEFDKVKVGDANYILVGLDLSPDRQCLAISSVQSNPMYIYDWSKREVVKEFDVGNWYAGSSVRYSPNGKYLLLQQLFYADWAPNKDREVNFEIIDIATGKMLKRFDNYHALAFTPDEKFVVSLTADEITFWSLETLKKEKNLKVSMASNGFAISPDGKYIAVSHHPDEGELKNNQKYIKDKKALKHVLKYKQQISIFNLETSKKEYTVKEFYDIVYRLDYSPDGKTLFCLQIPHEKANPGTQRQTYISIIDGVTGEPSRKGFVSRAAYEPDFKLSHDGKLFGVVSQGSRFVELHIYDFETKKMLHRFEQSYRFFEKTDGELAPADVRASFVFLPDNKNVIITMGSRLIFWNMEPDNQE